jgi:hypothetical protein
VLLLSPIKIQLADSIKDIHVVKAFESALELLNTR